MERQLRDGWRADQLVGAVIAISVVALVLYVVGMAFLPMPSGG